MARDGQDHTPQTLRGLREHFRTLRHREFLETALRIVSAEGLSALTMQRLAAELECSVGSIYRYFPSKNALLAEVQRESLEHLHASFLLSCSHLADLCEERQAGPRLAGLACVVGASRFWIEAEDTFPQEIVLLRRLFTDPDVEFTEEEAGHVLPLALGLLDLARRVLDDAVEVGALVPGDGGERAVIILAGTTGVLLTGGLAHREQLLVQAPRLAYDMVQSLLVGWGAEAEDLTVAGQLVSELKERGQLVPPAPIG